MNTEIKIFPKNLESIKLFQQIIQAPDDEKPLVEMNDTTARNMSIICSSIEALATRWRGRNDIRMPGMPTNRQAFWGAFSADHVPEPLPVANEFIESQNGQNKTAIDLGCGNKIGRAHV